MSKGVGFPYTVFPARSIPAQRQVPASPRVALPITTESLFLHTASEPPLGDVGRLIGYEQHL